MAARPRDASPASASRTALGFFDGVGALLRGFGFIVGRPAMWGWASIPIVAATTLFFGFVTLAIWGGSALAHAAISGEGAWSTAGLFALRLVFWLIGTALAFLVSITLAQPLSGFALDVIARRQELAVGGRAWPDQPFVASTFRSVRVTVVALAMSLPILALLALLTFLFPPASVVTLPLKFLVTGLAIAYDFLDYPLGLRGAGVRARFGFIRQNLAAVVGFGCAAALALLIPGIGLLLLPFGVAGAARLVVAADAHANRHAGAPAP